MKNKYILGLLLSGLLGFGIGRFVSPTTQLEDEVLKNFQSFKQRDDLGKSRDVSAYNSTNLCLASTIAGINREENTEIAVMFYRFKNLSQLDLGNNDDEKSRIASLLTIAQSFDFFRYVDGQKIYPSNNHARVISLYKKFRDFNIPLESSANLTIGLLL